jgi:hypothetical protein
MPPHNRSKGSPSSALPPHPATVSRGSVVQQKRASSALSPHPANRDRSAARAAVQRMRSPDPPRRPDRKAYAVSNVSFDRHKKVTKSSKNGALPRTTISLDDIRHAVREAAVRGGTAKLGQTGYQLTFKPGTISIAFGNLEGGHILAPEKDGVIAVETVKALYEECGLAKLLAAALYLYAEAGRATLIRLGTNDTSRGFWGHLGVSAAATPIGDALEKLGNIAIASDLSLAELAPPQDYTKSNVL